MVISGDCLSESAMLRDIFLHLNNLIGKKGTLQDLTDYWDVATFFEISVLAEDYGKASQAASVMFKLEPPRWYLKSTMGNIKLITNYRRELKKQKGESVDFDFFDKDEDEKLFEFWFYFFSEGASDESSTTWPVS